MSAPQVTAADSPLNSARWAISRLADPDVRVVDCRFSLQDPQAGARAYAAGHVHGAVYADLERDLSGPKQPGGAGGRHPLPDPQALAGWLGSAGIGDGTTVLAYDDPSGGQGFYAARLWWLLRWLGHAEVYVLDGGLPAYVAAGGELTDVVPEPAPRTFSTRVRPELLASAEDVQARAEGTLLIDSRAAARYRGDSEPLDRKAGHIPGAVNRDWAGALDQGGHWRPGAEQLARLGLGDAPAILYCGSGVSAAANLLALASAGRDVGPDTRLYAGSWSDWVSGEGRGVETGSGE